MGVDGGVQTVVFPFTSCASPKDPCTRTAECCSGVCDGASGTCEDVASEGSPCAFDTTCAGECESGACTARCTRRGGACSVDGDCCSGDCDTNGECTCLEVGATCATDVQCCSTKCDPATGTCADCTPPGGCTAESGSGCCHGLEEWGFCLECLGDDYPCADDEDCCSGVCDGRCVNCHVRGTSCTRDEQCCSRWCRASTGTCECRPAGSICQTHEQCCGSCHLGVCVAPGCPTNYPGRGDPCSHDGLECPYEIACCCGGCGVASAALCDQGNWIHVFPDACLFSPCEYFCSTE